MDNKLKLILAAFAWASLSVCATMSRDECLTSYWTTIGYEDGVRGYTADRIGRHRKACAKHGVTLDLAAYQSGRDQGLVEYCQPNRGFRIGSRGGHYNNVCSVNLEPDFLDAFNAGHHLYILRSNVRHANFDIDSRRTELNEIKDAIIATELALISSDTTREERLLLLFDLKESSERTGQLEAELEGLYEDRARHEVELEHYQMEVASFGY